MNKADRLLLFIQNCYGGRSVFADEINISRSTISRYITDKNFPTEESLLKFHKAGLSIDWYLTGNGSMYASNAKGIELENRNMFKNLRPVKNPFERIKYWIRINYITLENFCLINNLDYKKIKKVLFEEVLIDLELFEVLNKSGCNIHWLATGTGDMYENNPVGQILKNRMESYQMEFKDMDISDEDTYFLSMEPEIFNIIKEKLNDE